MEGLKRREINVNYSISGFVLQAMMGFNFKIFISVGLTNSENVQTVCRLQHTYFCHCHCRGHFLETVYQILKLSTLTWSSAQNFKKYMAKKPHWVVSLKVKTRRGYEANIKKSSSANNVTGKAEAVRNTLLT
jgi:hypothetical protein